MNKKLILSITILSISISSFAQVKLFNGKDLSGWKIHGTELWYVEKDELICESGPDKQYGYLVSDKAFTNFELTVDFKQESNGNSGVFFHCSIDGTKIAGWQAEVAPMNMHTGGIYESYGRGWLIQPNADGEKKLKEGEWNTMIVRVDGKKVTTFLNGSQMITLVDDKVGESTGKIALQIHDGGGVKVRWRNIQLKEL